MSVFKCWIHKDLYVTYAVLSTYGYVPARFWLSVSNRVAGEQISLWLLVNSLLTNLTDLVITAGVLVVLYGSEKKTEICCVFAPRYLGINFISQQIQYLFWNSIKPLLISPQAQNLNKSQYCSLLHISPEAIVWRMEADFIVDRSKGPQENWKWLANMKTWKSLTLNYPWEEEAVLDDQINALWYRAILSYFLSWLQRAKMVMRRAVILGFQLLDIKIESCWKEENSKPPYEYMCCISVEFWSESVLLFA